MNQPTDCGPWAFFVCDLEEGEGRGNTISLLKRRNFQEFNLMATNKHKAAAFKRFMA